MIWVVLVNITHQEPRNLSGWTQQKLISCYEKVSGQPGRGREGGRLLWVCSHSGSVPPRRGSCHNRHPASRQRRLTQDIAASAASPAVSLPPHGHTSLKQRRGDVVLLCSGGEASPFWQLLTQTVPQPGQCRGNIRNNVSEGCYVTSSSRRRSPRWEGEKPFLEEWSNVGEDLQLGGNSRVWGVVDVEEWS